MTSQELPQIKLNDLIDIIKSKNDNLAKKIAFAKLVIIWITKKYKQKEIAVGFSGGKDSTVLLHLIKTIYAGKIPFRVIFGDSRLEINEVYNFIENITSLWKIKLIRNHYLT
jgi:3'-phosphoadenosine 5'-phosphosulfate sulfotransferase (PAPS reductase)/FAD synthetase and related enzymes